MPDHSCEKLGLHIAYPYKGGSGDHLPRSAQGHRTYIQLSPSVDTCYCSYSDQNRKDLAFSKIYRLSDYCHHPFFTVNKQSPLTPFCFIICSFALILLLIIAFYVIKWSCTIFLNGCITFHCINAK